MSWKLDNIDFLDYGITVMQAVGVLDIPSIKDELHDWLDQDYTTAVRRDNELVINDRNIDLTCVLQAEGLSDFTSKLNSFYDAILATNKRELTHPYSLTTISVFITNAFEIQRLTAWNRDLQAGKFVLQLTVSGNPRYISTSLFDGTTHTIKGTLYFGKDAKHENVLQGVHEITCTIESPTVLDIKKNDFIQYNDFQESFIHFDEIDFVKYSTNRYVYKLKFENEGLSFRRTMVKNLDDFTEFYYWANLEEIVDLILLNTIENYGSLYLKGDIEDTVRKNHHIADENCFDLLKRICTEYECEFSVFPDLLDSVWGYVITAASILVDEIKAYDSDGPLDTIELKYGEGNGLYTIEREILNGEDLVTSLYVYSATTNLPFGSLGQRLPSSLNPIQDAGKIALYGLIEKVKNFDDIYPRGVRYVEEYIFVPGIIEPAFDTVTGTVVTHHLSVEKTPAQYIIKDTSLGFDINEQLTSDPAKIIFNTGDLAGYEFLINRFDNSKSYIYITPLTNEQNIVLPNETLFPEAGDEYVIININPPTIFTSECISELDDAGQDYFDDNSVLKLNFKVVMGPEFIDNFWDFGISFFNVRVGRSLKLTDAAYGINGELLRIVSTSFSFYSKEMDLTLSNIPKPKTTGTISQLQKEVKSLTITQNKLSTNQVSSKRTSTETVGDLKGEILNSTDKFFLNSKFRKEDLDPQMLAFDSGTPQFSLKNALISSDGNDVTVEAGTFINHHYNAIDRQSIADIKEAGAEYDPTESWTIEETELTLPNNNGHFIYLKVPIE